MNIKEVRDKLNDMNRDINASKKIDAHIEGLSSISYVFHSLSKEDRQTVYDAIAILRNKSEQLQRNSKEIRWDINQAIDVYENKSEN